MVESDVVAILTEEAAKLTERGIRKSDDAAVLELQTGLTPAVTVLREEATVLLEAARRVRGLQLDTPVRRAGKRGPNKRTTGNGLVQSNGHPEPGTGPVSPSGVSGANAVSSKWPGS